MTALEIVLYGLRWSFLGLVWFGVALIVGFIFGQIARYGRGEEIE